jgi:hypothetical protein
VHDLLGNDHGTSNTEKRRSKSLVPSNLRFSTLANYGHDMGNVQSREKVSTHVCAFHHHLLLYLPTLWMETLGCVSSESPKSF